MKKAVFILLGMCFINCQGQQQKTTASESQKTSQKATEKKYKVEKTEAEWRKQLSPKQYHILRNAGTELPHSGKYNKFYEEGVYSCAACGTKLYSSEHKFDSGTGWPSFDRGFTDSLELDVDYKIGYARTEVKCAMCGGHLGHVFNDGPKETTGKRHCINSAALNFTSLPVDN